MFVLKFSLYCFVFLNIIIIIVIIIVLYSLIYSLATPNWLSLLSTYSKNHKAVFSIMNLWITLHHVGFSVNPYLTLMWHYLIPTSQPPHTNMRILSDNWSVTNISFWSAYSYLAFGAYERQYDNREVPISSFLIFRVDYALFLFSSWLKETNFTEIIFPLFEAQFKCFTCYESHFHLSSLKTYVRKGNILLSPVIRKARQWFSNTV